MPLNEASGKPRRDRWPLEFDITGVPQDFATRHTLLEQKQELEKIMPQVQNSFAVDKPVQAITDINNPPHVNYKHQEFPRMLYDHDSGRILIVADDKELKAAQKRGFQLKPAPDRDYSKINRAGIASPAAAPNEELSAEVIDEA